MAYTGVNRAEHEARKYSQKSEFWKNTVSTVANSSIQIGQELITQSHKDTLQKLNNDAHTASITETLRIYDEYEPEDYEAKIAEFYDSHTDRVLGEIKENGAKAVPTSVAKEFKSEMETRKAQAVGMATAEKYKKVNDARVTYGFEELDEFIANPDAIAHNKKNGVISSKSSTTSEESEGDPIGSGSYVAPEASKFDVSSGGVPEVSEVNIKSEKIQKAFDRQASDHDLGILTIENIAQRMFPYDEKARESVIKEYTQKLKDRLPMFDMETNFNAQFSRSNSENWDYSGFRQWMEESLATQEYGEEPLTLEKQREVLGQLHNMWETLKAEYQSEANEIYSKDVKGAIFDARMSGVLDAKTPFTTSVVEGIYKGISDKTKIPMRFFQDFKNHDYETAIGNDRLENQKRLIDLYQIDNRSETQETEFQGLKSAFSNGEYVDLLQKLKITEATLANFAVEDALGVSYSTDVKAFKEVNDWIGATENLTLEAFYDALETDGASLAKTLEGESAEAGEELKEAIEGLTDYQKKVLGQKFQEKYSTQEALKAEKKIAEDKEFTELYNLDKRNEVQEARLKELTEKYGEIELASMATRSKAAKIALNDIAMKKAINDNDISSEVEFTDLFNRINDKEFVNDSAKFLTALEDKENLSKEHQNLLRSLYATQQSDNALIKSERRDKAENELEILNLTGQLTDDEIEIVAKKYGITKEDDAKFFSDWQKVNESKAEENFIKEFNSLNFDGTATTAQVAEIATKYSIGKDSSAYKKMNDIAEDNLKKYLVKLSNKGEGFGATTTETATKTVSEAIEQLRNGKKTKLQAIEVLEKNIGGFKKAAYLAQYDSIVSTDARNFAKESLVFEEQIYNPYLDEYDTITPGTSRQRMIDLGLDPKKFSKELSQIEDIEAINQHNNNLAIYQSAEMYVALSERGLDHDEITSLGYEPMDVTSRNTLRYVNDNPEESKLTNVELATEIAKNAKAKMIGDLLPSKTHFGGTTAEKADKAIEKEADRIQDEIVDALTPGGRVNVTRTKAVLETSRFFLEEREYHKRLDTALANKEITLDYFLKAKAEDISVYKGEEWKDKADALKRMENELRSNLKSFKDDKGKTIEVPLHAINSIVENGLATFDSAYEEIIAASGTFDVNDLVKKVYRTVIDDKYSEDASAFIKSVTQDTSVLNKGFFGKKRTTSHEDMTEFYKGELNLVDNELLGRFLNSPEETTASYGVSTGSVATWDTMLRNGLGHKEVGQQILHDTALQLGLLDNLPDVGSNNFEKKFKKYLENQPPAARNQIRQTAQVAKWSLDIMNLGREELSDIIPLLDSKRDTKPIIIDNKFGISVGDVDILFELGDGKNTYFSYDIGDNQRELIVASNSNIEHEKSKFDREFNQSFQLSKFAVAYFASWEKNKDSPYSPSTIKVDDGKLEQLFDKMLESASTSKRLQKAQQDYLSMMNVKVQETNKITGRNDPSYEKIEVLINWDLIRESTENNSLMDMPADQFFKYEFITVKD